LEAKNNYSLEVNKNPKLTTSINLVVEAGFIVTPKIAYVSFLSLDDYNILLHIVVHHLRPSLIGTVVRQKVDIYV